MVGGHAGNCIGMRPAPVIAIRVDASLVMGTGHVMRCLTLAEALRTQGAQCHFICRAHPGNLIATIRQHGFPVTEFSAGAAGFKPKLNEALPPSAHAQWLGCEWQTDAEQSLEAVQKINPAWVVVDHYALNLLWEGALAAHEHKLLVIDDLADRPHSCDLLLDQNLGRQPEHYAPLVPALCQVLTGPHYALLRPEFAALRPYSLQRRQAHPDLRRLLITMGGVDQLNATGQVLQTLKTCALPAACRITVVMGLTAPWLHDVQELAPQMPWATEVVVNVSDIARRMADSDLAIGAAGGTSWERCCLGLPTLMVLLAENQQAGAHALAAAHAALLIGATSDIATQLPQAVSELDSDGYSRMSLAASAITDGQGVEKILKAMGLRND